MIKNNILNNNKEKSDDDNNNEQSNSQIDYTQEVTKLTSATHIKFSPTEIFEFHLDFLL